MIATLEKTVPSLAQRAHLSITNSLEALSQLKEPAGLLFIERVASALASCFQAKNKVLIAGNGGSLCDAIHFAEELTGVFRKTRPALPAIALADPGHITCTGNDLGFDWVFARGVQAYGHSGDLFIGLTTSGLSPNIVKAVSVAKEMGLRTVTLLGKSGGTLAGVADLELIIRGETSDRIQEAHMAALHIIIELAESLLFPTVDSA